MKRYAVFTFQNYYPDGGWDDFWGFFDSIEQAKSIPVGPDYENGEPRFRKPPGARYPEFGDEYAQIVDLETGTVVFNGRKGEWTEVAP